MVGCSSVSSAGTCGAKRGMLGCLRGVLSGKKQQRSVDSKVGNFIWGTFLAALAHLFCPQGWQHPGGQPSSTITEIQLALALAERPSRKSKPRRPAAR